MTPIEFRVSRSKVKVTVTFKLGGVVYISETFLFFKFLCSFGQICSIKQEFLRNLFE